MFILKLTSPCFWLIFVAEIEEIEETLTYKSVKGSNQLIAETENWVKEEPEQNYKSQNNDDYYPEKEIREYLEAHPYVVQNYLFETSLKKG